MAEYNQIAVIERGRVENIETEGNIFSFETIRFGSADLTEAVIDDLLVLVNNVDASSLHNHDSSYFTKLELESTQENSSGSTKIGTDSAYNWQAIDFNGDYNLDVALRSIDSFLGQTSTKFSDANFAVFDDSDPTKEVRFDNTNVPAVTGITLTMPSDDLDLSTLATEEYVDNGVSLALSGLSPKSSVRLVSTPLDINPRQAEAILLFAVNALGSDIDEGYLEVYDVPSNHAGDFDEYYMFYFDTTGSAPAPSVADAPISAHRVTINPSDDYIELTEKLKNAINSAIPTLVTALDNNDDPDVAIGGIRILYNNEESVRVMEADAIAEDFIEIEYPEQEIDTVQGLIGFEGISSSFDATLNELTIENIQVNSTLEAPNFDSRSFSGGDRVLIIDDNGVVDPEYQGIWQVANTITEASFPYRTVATFVRPDDADGLSGSPPQLDLDQIKPGTYCFVFDGENEGQKAYIQIGEGPIQVNVTPQEWTVYRAESPVTGSDFIFIDTFGQINLQPLQTNALIVGAPDGLPVRVFTNGAGSDILAAQTGITIKDDRITDSMIMSGQTLDTAITFFNGTSISAAQANNLIDGTNADSLHIHDTTNITEGANLYFTEARVRNTPLDGLNVSLTGDIQATDTVIQAFGKLQNTASSIDNDKASRSLSNLLPTAINQSLIPEDDNTVDLGSSSLKFKDGYFAGKLTVDGGIDPIYLQITGLSSDSSVPNNSLWVLDNTEKTLRYKDGQGVSDDIVMKAVSQVLENKTLDFSSTGNNTITISTDEVTEGANLYYTDQRFDDRLATKDTDDLAEGSNLYYTDQRFDDRLATKDTSDLTEGSNLYHTSQRVDDRIALQKAEPNGLATLDSNGVIPSNQIPSIAITNVSVVADITERDNLTPEVGDVAKVLDGDGSGNLRVFMYDGSEWKLLKSDDAVDTVNGQTGTVLLTTTNINEGTNLYYTDTRARDAVSAAGDLSYNSSTGQFSVTTYKTADFDIDFSTKDTDDLTESATRKFLLTSAQDIEGTKTFKDNVVLESTVINDVKNIAATDINWSLGSIYQRSVSSNTTFTFSSSVSGQTIIVKIENTDSLPVTVNFPSSVQWSNDTPIDSIDGESSNIYTFINIGGDIYASTIENLR